VKDVEPLNSCAIIEVDLDEIPLTLGGDSLMPCLPTTRVNPFHVIFKLNKILIATHFNKDKYGKITFHIVILHHGLKEF
jgi:hypothetical protein